MHEYVQKSSSTTLPRRPASVSGFVLNHWPPGMIGGAFGDDHGQARGARPGLGDRRRRGRRRLVERSSACRRGASSSSVWAVAVSSVCFCSAAV